MAKKTGIQQRYKLGELLIRAGVLTEEQLQKALRVQQAEGGRLGEALVKLGLVTEADLMVAIGKQMGIPYASLASGLLTPSRDQALDRLVPADFARQHVLLPISRNLDSMTVALADPLDLITMDNLSKMTRCRVNPIVATQSDLLQAIDQFYGLDGKSDKQLTAAINHSYASALDTLSPTDAETEEEVLSLDQLKAEAEEAPVVRLVDLIIRQAIKERASDIHVEPQRDRIMLRYRIDGVLHEITPPAKHSHLAIVSRVKILAKLDIAEKRLPQDGSFMMAMEGRQIDFRVSTIPSLYGERLVIRILDKSNILLDLSQLGFDSAQLTEFRRAIRMPYGLILVTGPTGSGKTTTLYGALNEIRAPEKNILTIEDPVEYRLEGVSQVQVKPHIGLTFATGLRAFLRQDPDIILVGEVRDLETAEICVRSALTGHLVLSSVHTNDAPGAVTRLIDIGVAPFLLSSTVSLVMAQRLLRKLCPTCKEPYEPSPELRRKLGRSDQELLLYRPKGCDHCGQTGYRGRTAIFEAMTMSTELRDIIARGAATHTLRDAAIKEGLVTLWEAGVAKVLDGATSLEELMSVVLLEKE
ncbi:MAG: Flp pilus assembly complex ATPase component TadA [Candidatus Omnitrophica bacterium]|nr:Flp pilus assembly complex ATPase component TadA [Candidatus Omnitrophota bacterium]